ncbi:MAG: hypothetical protein K2H20_00935 [Bacilli bacterium]|nr:hypothetical protein [Bacilli bacterium]
MENKLHILEPIIVINTNTDGSLSRYSDYYYCGHGMLAYQNIDHYRYPKECKLWYCFGKFHTETDRPTYYIPRRYIKEFKDTHIVFVEGCKLDDFEVNKIIDLDTLENCKFNSADYPWFAELKEDADKYNEIYTKEKTN